MKGENGSIESDVKTIEVSLQGTRLLPCIANKVALRMQVAYIEQNNVFWNMANMTIYKAYNFLKIITYLSCRDMLMEAQSSMNIA